MGEEKLVKVSVPTAAALCRGLPLSAPARQLLGADLEPQAYVDLLVKEQLFLDAIRVLSRGLPPREAVFWACLCTRQLLPCPRQTLDQQAALRAAAAWVLQPSEPSRLAAREAGEKAKLSTPAGCAALAAFWSADHTSDPEESKHLAVRAAGAAVMIAAASGPVANLAQRYHQFVDLGLKIAAGTCSWDIADKKDGTHHDA